MGDAVVRALWRVRPREDRIKGDAVERALWRERPRDGIDVCAAV